MFALNMPKYTVKCTKLHHFLIFVSKSGCITTPPISEKLPPPPRFEHRITPLVTTDFSLKKFNITIMVQKI